jgi:predicted NUDIX family phosphoesterase
MFLQNNNLLLMNAYQTLRTIINMTTTTEEQVLIIPKMVFINQYPELHHAKKFAVHTYSELTTTKLSFIGKSYGFMPRSLAEKDENYLQIIPYFTIQLNVRNEKYILAYSRSNKSGEQRLKNKYSIGFGGHLNQRDSEIAYRGGMIWDAKKFTLDEAIFHRILQIGINREFNEELKSQYEKCISRLFVFRGFIYDPTTEVGKVHLGLVFNYVYELGEYNRNLFEINDPSIKTIKWKTQHQLEQDIKSVEAPTDLIGEIPKTIEYEPWSEIIISQGMLC